MLLENDLNNLLRHLLQKEDAEIFFHGSLLSLKLNDLEGKDFVISTPVYSGGNYIPNSVRVGLKEHPEFARHKLSTKFDVDEEHFLITLLHKERFDGISKDHLVTTIEEFAFLADEWRSFFDEQDKNDLVHIKIR